MGHEADYPRREPDNDREHAAHELPLAPVSLEDLRAAADRWRRQPDELARLRRMLRGSDADSVASYRIGSAEGTVLFAGLNGLGEIVESALEEIYTSIETPKEEQGPIDSQRIEDSIQTLVEVLRGAGGSQT